MSFMIKLHISEASGKFKWGGMYPGKKTVLGEVPYASKK